jgi:serine-aspartate repeat-containing protein C/D/E
MSSSRIEFLAAFTFATILSAACSPAAYSISDYTWNDVNMNGIQDEGEGPLSNVKIDLEGGDTLKKSTSSDKDGFYEFGGLPAGDYQLTFTPPTDFAITQKDAGEDDSIDSDIYPSGNDSGRTDIITVGPDTVDVDAGFFTSAPAPTPTPTPEGVIQSPTGQAITATPAQASGSAEVGLSVTYDAAAHKVFVALSDTTTVQVEQSNGTVSLSFASPDGATQITLSGPIDENGAADLTGTGLVAGFQSVSGTFVGTIEVASDGSLIVNGELTLGANGELPQSEPIKYEVSN